MSSGAVVLAALLAGLAAASPAVSQPDPSRDAAATPELRPLPEPPLDRMDPDVRERLDALRSSVAGDLADPATDRGRLTAGFARLGQLYLLYQLDQAARDCFWNAGVLDPADARWAYYLGVARERLGKQAGAIESYERVLAVRPHDEATLVRRGRLALQAGDLATAEERFRRVLEQAPESAAAHQGLGQAAALREDWNAAAEHLSRALELQPAASALHYELGLAFRELGDMDRAREQMAQRGDAQPSFPDPLIDGLETLAPGARQYRRRGGEAFARGDLAGAEAAYRQAIEADPDDAVAYEALGSVLSLENRLSEAISSYRRALELDPEDARAHHDAARLLLRASRTEEAADHLRRAVELVPDYAAAYHDLAAALERQGRLEEAEAAARQAVELQPEDAGERLFHARLRLLAAVDPWQDPERELRRVLEKDPGDGMAWLTLGSLLRSRGETEAALAAYRTVLGLEGSDLETRALQARAHLLIAASSAAGDAASQEAVDHLHAAARLAPDLPEVHLALAKALASRGDHAGAAQAYRLALGLDPGRVEAITGLAEELLRSDRCIEAREHLERSVAAAPGAPGLEELLTRVRKTCPGG